MQIMSSPKQIKMIKNSFHVLAEIKGFHITSNVTNKVSLEKEKELALIVMNVPDGRCNLKGEEFLVDTFSKTQLVFSGEVPTPFENCETIIEISARDKEAIAALGAAFWNDEREADGMLYCFNARVILTCTLKQIVYPKTQSPEVARTSNKMLDLDVDKAVTSIFQNRKK
jgi:hypothetical protein